MSFRFAVISILKTRCLVSFWCEGKREVGLALELGLSTLRTICACCYFARNASNVATVRFRILYCIYQIQRKIQILLTVNDSIVSLNAVNDEKLLLQIAFSNGQHYGLFLCLRTVR